MPQWYSDKQRRSNRLRAKSPEQRGARISEQARAEHIRSAEVLKDKRIRQAKVFISGDRVRTEDGREGVVAKVERWAVFVRFARAGKPVSFAPEVLTNLSR